MKLYRWTIKFLIYISNCIEQALSYDDQYENYKDICRYKIK